MIRFVAASMACALLCCALSLTSFAAAAYYEDTPAQASAALDVSDINDDFTVNPDFTSHLPLIVIDTHGEIIEKLTVADLNLSYRVPVEGAKPYVLADVLVYENENGMNSLSDAPAFTSEMRIHRHGNTSMDFDKGNYKINLITETGQERKTELLGLDREDEWILVGTERDRSLMRNFIAYTVTKEIMPYTPDSRYCEVVFKNGDTFEYGGVFLVVENVKQGIGRVEIVTDRSNDLLNGFIVRRDRLDPTSPFLDTWARRNRITQDMADYVFNLEYPKPETADQGVIRAIEARISEVERILYSDKPSVFLSYPDYIDEDSFIDYFLVNEFFNNYDAGFNSTYMYLNANGKLAAGPIWDYDGNLDAYRLGLFEPEYLAFCAAPWFERLIKSERFLTKSIARYFELRRTVFSNETISGLIDDTAAFLGKAAERDWKRWNYGTGDTRSYALVLDDLENAYGELVTRNTRSFGEETLKNRHLLNAHGKSIAEELEKLTWKPDDLIKQEENTLVNQLLGVWLITLVLASSVIAKRL